MATSAAKSAAKARERRSKLLAIGLGVVLLAVAVIQGPKLMKQLSGSKPSASPAPAAVATASTAGSTPVSSASASPATLARSPLAPAPAAGQLASFSRFAAKDVFHQQITVGTSGSSTGSGASSSSTPPSKPPATATSTPSPQGKPLTFAVTPNGAKKATGPLVPAALLRFNGKKTVVALGDTFPLKHPLFRLVSLSSKFVTIKLIGGSFSDGKTTLRIDFGHPLKLANVTNASNYLIGLVRPTTTHPRSNPANPAK